MAAIGFAAAAQAQAPLADGSEVETIVVTASRITTAGFDAPTPTTVLGQDLIQKSAEPNVFTTISQLPSLQGSTGTTVANGNTSTGATGLSALNMRGLGSTRTLTLIDGQRVVPSLNTGIADVSQFPQLLIQRVDVVTGGASASYGSDAVAGVVNFITDRRFVGFKATLQGGMTTYGDGKRQSLQAAYGNTFLGGRGHFQLSGEYMHNDGIPGALLGAEPINGRRRPNTNGNASYSIPGTPAGLPQNYHYPAGAQNITRGRNGLITAGPLQGIAFGDNGVPYTFDYGGSGVPRRTSAGGVIGCVANTCEGGELTGSNAGASAIDAMINRAVAYGRVSYELTSRLEVFGTYTHSDVFTITAPTRGAPKPNLTIQCGNAFLHPSISDACAANGITTFRFGTAAQNLNHQTKVNNSRSQRRFVVGADGSFDFAGKEWTFNSYFQHGESVTDVHITNITLTPHYNAAIDAVRLPNGQIACRSTAARAAGCVPFNPFGNVVNTEEAFRWMAPANGPRQHTYLKQDAASIAFNGTPFSLPAGDVAVAFGAEWREETYKAYGDAYGSGFANSPLNDMYPGNALLASNGGNWYAGNFYNGRGRYDVREGFIEAGIPVWNNDAAGDFDLNVAVRATNYSTSGWVATWKVGGTWDTPIDGVRLRAVRSRDIRAPNLSDLYAAPVVMNNFVTNRANNQSVQILNNAVGNPDLTPEISRNTELGIVFRPSWLPGLSLSADYFNIRLTDAIQALNNQQIVDLCFNGNTDACANVYLEGTPGTNNPSFVMVRPFNLASVKTDGFDIEASYRFSLRDSGVPGDWTVRGLYTRTLNFIQDTGLQGQRIRQLAGANSGDIPFWKAFLQQSWTLGGLQLTATERIVSAGEIDRDYVVCQTGCPLPTVQNPTANFNRVEGAAYVDFGASYNVRQGLQVFGKVDNVFNKWQPVFGSTTLYDTVGRRFQVGVRITR